jgi:type IV pilus assembly protein PilA
MHTRRERGFSLIELMLVVAIAGILASIALAAYQDNVRRTRIAEVIDGATACKTAVREYFAATTPEVNSYAAPHCDGPRSLYVANFLVASSGEIIIQSAVPGAEGYLQLTPMAADGLPVNVMNMPQHIHRWRCGPAHSSLGAVDARYLPGSCREGVPG